MEGQLRDDLLAIRRGEADMNAVVDRVKCLLSQSEQRVTSLPESVDVGLLNAWLHSVYGISPFASQQLATTYFVVVASHAVTN